MKPPRLDESPVDHHIQAHILQQLFKDGGNVPFGHLKPDDVQNSLFMYHMQKLESRGLVIRSEDGFSLTQSGARWVNFVSPSKLKPRLSPRVLIKFLLFSPDRSMIVISKRRSAASKHLNVYALPSGFQKYGISFIDSAIEVLEVRTGEKSRLKDLGMHETIYRYSDGYVHHVVTSFFEATIDVEQFPEDEHYELVWAPIEEIKKGAYDESLVEILNWYESGQSFSGKTFDITLR